MALNLDTTFRLKAKVEGAKSVDNFKKQLKGLDTSSKMSKAQLGKMNIEINRMARAAGNTTRGLRQHIKALTLLRDRTEIGGRAYKRLGGQNCLVRTIGDEEKIIPVDIYGGVDPASSLSMRADFL